MLTANVREDYIEYRDKLEALDRLNSQPKVNKAFAAFCDAQATDLCRKLRDIEDAFDQDDLNAIYDDPEKEEVKEEQIASYMRIFSSQFSPQRSPCDLPSPFES